MTGTPQSFFDRVYVLVRRIPRGRVATYGQVAALLGVPRGARAVGWALRGIGGRAASVPWHRVVGQAGRISLDGRPSGLLQRRRLRQEGVRFTAGHVDMDRHGILAGGDRLVKPRGSRKRAASEAGFTPAKRAGVWGVRRSTPQLIKD